MQMTSITMVKEQIEVYRKTRSDRKQPIPDEIILILKTLARILFPINVWQESKSVEAWRCQLRSRIA
jgi:hypothetical protein